ncbi:MAG: hypothetical protein AB1589_00760 [Cyanobacteriota bacterium]
MSFQESNFNTQEWSDLVSAVVEATLTQNQSTLNQLLKQVIDVIPAHQPEPLRGQTASNLLIQIAQELEKSLDRPNHPILAWFVVYVGLGSSSPEAIQAVQMLLDQEFKPFDDFFVDSQGIHFYDQGATPEKLQQLPQRLSEFTQMTIRMEISEINHIIERFNLSENEARNVLINLKILEQKMKIPIDQLLSILDYNDDLLQNVIESDLTQGDHINRFGA